MKTTFISSMLTKRLATFLVFGSLLLLAACRQDQPPVEPTDRNCSKAGTFVRVMCGVSIYDNLWIKLDNGTYLQPCETDIRYICPPDFQEGQRVKVGYVPASAHTACNEMITCMAVPPPHKTVRITCLEVINKCGTKPCNFTGTLRDYSAVASPLPCGWIIVGDNGTNIMPVEAPAGFVYRNGKRVRYGFIAADSPGPLCMNAIAGKMTCMEEIDAPVNAECKPMLDGTAKSKAASVPATVQIQDARIENGCLKLTAGFSGCNDDISRFDLVWDGYVAKSNPSQTTVRLVDNAPQMCEAYFTKTLSFDLTRLNPFRPVLITVDGWNQPLLYQ